MPETSRVVVQSVLENEFQPMIRQKEEESLCQAKPIVLKQPKSTPQTSARVSKSTRVVISELVLENEFQPMIRQKEADTLCQSEPIVPKQPKSTRSTKTQTSTRVSKSTRIVISELDLDDTVYSITKPQRAPIHQIVCLLMFVFLFALLFVWLKYVAYGEGFEQ